MNEGLEDTLLPGRATDGGASTGGPPTSRCADCSAEVSAGANFCQACGSRVAEIPAPRSSLSTPYRDRPIDGRYRILEKLGEGGMGAVYKVEHVRMGKIAALKLMRPEFASDRDLTSRFLLEARVVAKLTHPNTVQVFDTGSLDDGALYIAMEYVPGRDLAWHLRTHGRLLEEKAVGIGLQLLASLQEAHEAGVVHRDIKPANVMLVRRQRSGDEQVKLLDFGIAKLQELEGRRSSPGEFVGTPAYMSPEQIRAEAVDARSDLYAVGALLFELVTGRQPFVGDTPAVVVRQHLDGSIPRIAEVSADAIVSPAFEAVLRRALAKAPAERFPDAESMRAALKQLRSDSSGTTRDFTPLPADLAAKMLSRQDFDRYEARLRFRRVAAPLATLVLLAAAGVATWQKLERDAAEAPRHFSREREPNDGPKTATPIALDAPTEGTIGASGSTEGDRDVYVAWLPDAGHVRVMLSAVADLNLTLEVSQLESDETGGPERLRRRLFLDDVGVGASERVDALLLDEGRVYFRVEERPFCAEPARPAREKSLVPYTLRVVAQTHKNPAQAWEAEPNDSESTAQRLPADRALLGFCGARVDDLERLSLMRPEAPFSSPDWFRVDAAPGAAVTIAVVPPERGGLALLDGAAVELWRQRRTVSTAKNPAPHAPVPLPVRDQPVLVDLAPSPSGARRFRLTAAADSSPGARYHVASLSEHEGGLSAFEDLVRLLREDGRSGAADSLLTAALRRFPAEPQLSRLRALLPSSAVSAPPSPPSPGRR